jgi:hypothetical protein
MAPAFVCEEHVRRAPPEEAGKGERAKPEPEEKEQEVEESKHEQHAYHEESEVKREDAAALPGLDNV